MEDGTMSRQPAHAPGPTGSKGPSGTSKQVIVTDPRLLFIQAVRDALDQQTLPDTPPSQATMEAYFRTFLAGNAYDERRAFFNYALAFYIHINEFNPTGDVGYPGGTCDRWTDLTSRTLRNGRRVIDCEGYAFLASILLVAAGWTLDGYRLAYSTADTSNFHIAAQLTLGSDTVCVGGPRPTTGSMHNEARRVFTGRFSILQDVFASQQDARAATRQASP